MKYKWVYKIRRNFREGKFIATLIYEIYESSYNKRFLNTIIQHQTQKKKKKKKKKKNYIALETKKKQRSLSKKAM